MEILLPLLVNSVADVAACADKIDINRQAITPVAKALQIDLSSWCIFSFPGGSCILFTITNMAKC